MTERKRVALLASHPEYEVGFFRRDVHPELVMYVKAAGYTPKAWLFDDLTTEPYSAPKPPIADEALEAMVVAARGGYLGPRFLWERTRDGEYFYLTAKTLDALDLTPEQRTRAEELWRNGK